MRRLGLSLAVGIGLMVASLTGGCASTQQVVNPFKVEKAKFVEKVKVIAVTPTELPPNVASDSASTQTNFNNLIESRLQESGYTVIHVSEYASIKEKAFKDIGGYYDTTTGAFDEAKYNSTQNKINEEIAAKYHPDAILKPEILFVKAKFNSPTANWDDTTETMEAGGITFFKALGGVTSYGTIPALSLEINIYDANDNALLYSKRGGIQILEQQVSVNINEGFQKIPKDKVLTDKGKNTNAIQISLKDIITKTKK